MTDRTSTHTVTVVVPTRNSGTRVTELCRRLAPVLDGLAEQSEVIVVDDGSTDDTWQTIRAAARTDHRVVGLRLRRSVGQSGALLAGFDAASGSIVATMDDDLEIDPGELPRFVAAVASGIELVSGRRTGQRPTLRAFGSRLYNARLRGLGFPLHDAGCGYNAITLELAHAMVDQGWNARQHRCKFVATSICRSSVDLDVAVAPTDSSRYSVSGLAASWIDAELAFGSLSPTGITAAAASPPLLVALASTRRHRPLAVSALVVASASAVAVRRALAASRALDERAATEPPFEVAERTSGDVI